MSESGNVKEKAEGKKSLSDALEKVKKLAKEKKILVGVKTTGLAGGLIRPYKGLFPALGLKTHRKQFAKRNIIYLLSPKGLFLLVSFYRLTRKRVNILF